LFHALNNLIWYEKDGFAVHGCHSVWHEKLCLDTASVVRNPGLNLSEKVITLFDKLKLTYYGNQFSMTNYSLMHVALSSLCAFAIPGATKLLLVYGFFYMQFCIVILLIYVIGRSMWNQSAGLWAMIIASCYPGFIGLSRKVNTLLFTCIALLLLVLFMQKEKIRSILWFVPISFFIIMGILTSPVYFAFMIPLVVYFVLRMGFVQRSKVGWLIQVALLICTIAMFFHGYINGEYARFYETTANVITEAYDKLTFKSDSFIGSAKEGLVESFLFASQDSVCPCTQTTNTGFNLKTFLFYGAELLRYASIPFFFIGLICFLWMLVTRDTKKHHKSLLFFWLVAGYIILSLFDIKWGKFCAPLLPVFALSTGYVVSQKMPLRKFLQPTVVILGIFVVLYSSYVPHPRVHWLEKLTEGIVAHRPLPSNFEGVASSTASKIQDALEQKKEPWKIILIDKDSARFMDDHWVSDMSVRIGILISMNIPQYHHYNFYWNADDETLSAINESDIINIITHDPIDDINTYLFEGHQDLIKIQLLQQDVVKEKTYLYTFTVEKHKNSEK
jgi:hypothetical protein